MCFFNTINFRIRTVSWRCAAIPTLGAAARSADCRHTEKAACTPTIFKCRQPSAGNRTPTSPPRGRGQNSPPFGTEIRAARRSPHPNPLPRERGWICCELKKSSLHLEYLKCRLLFHGGEAASSQICRHTHSAKSGLICVCSGSTYTEFGTSVGFSFTASFSVTNT